MSLGALQERVKAGPFVGKQLVTAETLKVRPAKADPRLGFLLDESER